MKSIRSEILFHESKNLFIYFNKYIPQLDFRWADSVDVDNGVDGKTTVMGGKLWKSSQKPVKKYLNFRQIDGQSKINKTVQCIYGTANALRYLANSRAESCTYK